MKSNTLKLNKSRSAISFVEIMLAFIILASVFLPIFQFLTGSVKDTEKFYSETVAISRAKFIMDSLMFQMPWRVLREGANEGSPCRFEDPKKKPGVVTFINKAVPKMIGDGCATAKSGVYKGEGIYTDRKGFKYLAKVKVIDMDYGGVGGITFSVDANVPPVSKPFQIKDLVPKDADGKYNLIKKIIVQIKWSNHKGKNPKKDSNAKSVFLVAYKSKLEG